MKTRVFVGGAVVIAIVAVVVWQARSAQPQRSAAPAESQRAAGARPALRPDPQTPAPKTADASFDRLRTDALVRFDGEMTTRVQLCTNEGGTMAAAPQPRDVRLVFEWMPDLSTPEFQTLVVKEVSIIDIGGLSTASRDCIRRATGMQLRIPVTADHLPLDARTFDQIVKVPVP